MVQSPGGNGAHTLSLFGFIGALRANGTVTSSSYPDSASIPPEELTE